MANRKVVNPVYEENDGSIHPEHQEVNTRVSHYLRMYATGKISEFPTNGMRENPELPEGLRKDLLNRDLPLPELGTDPVEVMEYINSHMEDYQALVDEYNMAVDDAEKYEQAMSVLDDDNATTDEKIAAARIVEAIQTKARARSY